MSTNCVRCVVNKRTSFDLLCDTCRELAAKEKESQPKRHYTLNPPPTTPMEELTDESYMTFGKYSKGSDRCKMRKVPPKYLLWLWDNGIWKDYSKPIHAYIKKSMKALLQEEPDYILEHKP